MLALALAGCGSVRDTQPKTTATYEYLLGVSAAEAVQNVATHALRDHLVYVDYSEVRHYEHAGRATKEKSPSREQLFLVGELRANLLEQGVRLTDDVKKADIILAVWSGGIGIDQYQTVIGIPSTTVAGVPGPAGQELQKTPEVVVFKADRRFGIADAAYVAYWADTGEIIALSDPGVGISRAERMRYFVFISKKTGNIAPLEVGDGKAE